MSYAMLYQSVKRVRENDEKLMRQVLNEHDSKIERSVLYQGKEVFINKIRIDTIYKRVNETQHGYGLETDYYKVVVSFSKIENNPKGYVILVIKEESELLAFKKAYEKGQEINLDEYEIEQFCESIGQTKTVSAERAL